MLAVARGKDPAAEKKAERGSGTFADLHQRYLEEHAKKRNKSWRQAEALVNRHVLPRWGKLQILLQKSFAFFVSSDSVALMRFAMEAVDDGAAQS
jgi:hypothetical protein